MILCLFEFYTTVTALKNVFNIFGILLFFVCFTNVESLTNSSSPSPTSKQSTTNENVIVVTPEILFTIPHEGDKIRFECSKNNDVISWIFPDDEIHTLIKDENFTSVILDNTFNITKNHLEILGVKHGMDGRYSCILKDKTKYNFFIPHIVSDARITKSIMISLSVTGIFCVMCLIILIVDKYCFSDIDVVKAQTLQKSLRKKNVSSATMTKLEFPPA